MKSDFNHHSLFPITQKHFFPRHHFSTKSLHKTDVCFSTTRALVLNFGVLLQKKVLFFAYINNWQHNCTARVPRNRECHTKRTRIGDRIQKTGRISRKIEKKVDQLTRRQKEIVATVALTLVQFNPKVHR